MAKVKIQGHASGTGILTVTAPNTSSDRTITLPDATGTLLNSDGDGSSLTGVGGDLSFGGDTFGADKTIGSNDTYSLSFETDGTERLKLHSDGRGLSQFTAKAWVNFNGEDTLAVRDSHNVSSVTDNATGDYTVNFTSAMADANYCTQFTGSHYNDGLVARTNVLYYDTPQTTTTVRLRSKVTWGSDSYADLDSPNSNVLVFGD